MEGGVGKCDGLECNTSFIKEILKLCAVAPVSTASVVAVGVQHVEGLSPTDSQISKVVTASFSHSTLMF